MSFTANVLRILIASPSDLPEEREAAVTTVYKWNAQHAEAESAVLLPVAWETHATPRTGVRPQQAINEQLVDTSDILIGMFWTKLGTSTGVASSGTVEEIERFVSAGKPALLYFSKRPIDPGKVDPKQNRKLKAFRDATYSTALGGTFDSIESLQETITRDLLSQVRSLNLKNARGSGISTVAANSASPGEPVVEDEQSNSIPNETWNRDAYESAAFFAIYKKREAQFNVIDVAYRKLSEFGESDNAATWQAFIEWARIKFGKSGQLQKLKKLAEDYPASDRILSLLGSAYEQFGQHNYAADTYLCAMESAKSRETKASHAAKAIDQLQNAKNQTKLAETLTKLRALVVETPGLEPILTKAVQSIVEAEKDNPFTIALLERNIELMPDDYEARFQLAFKQSEAGNDAIALHHYYKIPPNERGSETWNNLGAVSDQLAMPAKAVTAYNRAVEMNETLAMSNLGFKFKNAGFLNLAREQCNKALKYSNPHANVGLLVSALAAVEDNENLLRDAALDGVARPISILQRAGRAATRETPKTLSEKWQGPDCEFKLTLRDDRITLKGVYEREAGGLLANLFVPPAAGLVGGPARVTHKNKYTIKYSGKIRGLAVIGEVKREQEGASMLANAAAESTIVMIISDDGGEISVFEKATSKDPTMHVLRRCE
ncbi:hypothetical protein ACVSQB_32835 [Bradyrhizobium elkanii]